MPIQEILKFSVFGFEFKTPAGTSLWHIEPDIVRHVPDFHLS